jgi:hypothetical protein
MHIVTLSPNQVITLHDFPLHSEQVLKLYFRMYEQGCGHIVPPSPVMRCGLVQPAFNKATETSLNEWLQSNKQVEFFLLDGSHKTTAATLAKEPLRCMVYEKDADIAEAKELVKSGQLMSLTVEDTIQKNAGVLKGYFEKDPTFQTVADKTQRMVDEKVIPDYMITLFKQ